MRKLDLHIRQLEAVILQKKETLDKIKSINSDLLRTARQLKHQIEFQQNGAKSSDSENDSMIPPLLQSLIVRRKNIMSSVKTLNKLKRKTSIELEDAANELKHLESIKLKLMSKSK